MKALNLVTLVLIIIGGLNWGLFAISDVDLVASLFGGAQGMLAKLVYAIIGLSALYQLVPFVKAINIGEVNAERGHI